MPDAYSRGRIIGVYARLALYGADYLMAEKVEDWNALTEIDEETIRLREEINLQYQSLKEVVRLGDLYGLDVRRPAMNVKRSYPMGEYRFHGCLPCRKWCCYFSWTCANRS